MKHDVPTKTNILTDRTGYVKLAVLVAQQGIDNPEPNTVTPWTPGRQPKGPGHRADKLQVLRLRYQPEGLFFPPEWDWPPGWGGRTTGGVHRARGR